jgi:hypothetical protein
MRVCDIITEDDFTKIEDEADTRGDSALVTVLEWLRNEAAESSAVTPRVAADTVIKLVRNIAGHESFNFAALDSAYKQNESIKALVKDIKDDTQSGTKYVYLAVPENTVDVDDPLGAKSAPPGDPAKVVASMAKKAASK